MTNGDKLRKLLKSTATLTLPGVYDCLSALTAEKAGFNCLFTSGFGISASAYGKPDYGIISSTEMISVISNILNTISVPLVVDLDTGYGNALNVINNVKKVCELGAAGFILEDQVWPKRCGHMDGKQVIESSEYIEKLRAAVDTAKEYNAVVIARTDSYAVHGLDEAIKRGHECLNSGADILFIEAPGTVKDLTAISQEFEGKWLFANMVEGGKTPILSHKELESLGFKVVVYPLTGLFSSINALTMSYNYLLSNNTSVGLNKMITFSEYEQLIGLDRYIKTEKKFRG